MLHFGKIPKKFGENLARFSKKFSKILAKFAKILKKSAKISAIFNEKIESRERISARAFQRIFSCKIWLRYSRERALSTPGPGGGCYVRGHRTPRSAPGTCGASSVARPVALCCSPTATENLPRTSLHESTWKHRAEAKSIQVHRRYVSHPRFL